MQAFKNFKVEPLKSEEEFKEFYVERPEQTPSPIEEILERLKLSDNPEKYLFLGFRGCGKSTELYRLKIELENLKEFLPVMVSIYELDVNDIDIRDFLVLLGIKLIQTAKEKGIRIDASVEEDFRDFLTNVSHVREEEIKTASSIGGGVDLFGLIKAKLGLEATTRETIRKELTLKITELISRINNLIIEIEYESKKMIVIIADDLDKLTRFVQAEDFFYKNHRLLTQISAHAIYTFPISLGFDVRFPHVANAFDDYFTIPQVPPFKKDGNIWNEGFKFYENVVARRMDLNLIGEDALKKAIMSTGKLSEFISIVRESCIYAHRRRDSKIRVEDVRKALDKLRTFYSRTLTEEHMEVLRSVHETKDARDRGVEDRIVRDLLFSLMLVEYKVDEELWYEVNPLLIPVVREE